MRLAMKHVQICPTNLRPVVIDAFVALMDPQSGGGIDCTTGSDSRLHLVVETMAAAGVFKSLGLLLAARLEHLSGLQENGRKQKYDEIAWMPAAAQSMLASAVAHPNAR